MIVQSFQNSTSRKSCLFSIDVASMFRRFCVDVSSILCRCLLGYMSILGPYSVRILLLLLRIITGTSTSRICASGVVHPIMVPLIVSSHFLNVALIVSWLNLMICDRTCTVIYRTRIISNLDFENFLPVSCRSCVDVSSVLCRFFVYLVSMLAWFSVNIRSVFCAYHRACSQDPA